METPNDEPIVQVVNKHQEIHAAINWETEVDQIFSFRNYPGISIIFSNAGAIDGEESLSWSIRVDREDVSLLEKLSSFNVKKDSEGIVYITEEDEKIVYRNQDTKKFAYIHQCCISIYALTT